MPIQLQNKTGCDVHAITATKQQRRRRRNFWTCTDLLLEMPWSGALGVATVDATKRLFICKNAQSTGDQESVGLRPHNSQLRVTSHSHIVTVTDTAPLYSVI